MVYMQNLPISMPIIKAANKSTILALPSAGVSPAVATIVVVLLDAGATVRRAVAVGDAVFAGSDFFGSGLLGFDAAGFAVACAVAMITGAAAGFEAVLSGARTGGASFSATAGLEAGTLDAGAGAGAGVGPAAVVKLNAHFILSSIIIGTFFHCTQIHR